MDNLIALAGKGGVGKSSISAATAVHLSYLLPEKSILLVSFDIAHNLSDLFEDTIGNDITQLRSNLFAIEPDPSRYAENYMHEITQKTRQLFKSSIFLNVIPEFEDIIEEAIQTENIPLAIKNALFFQSILDAENPLADIGEERLTYRAMGQKPSTPYSQRPNIPAFDIIVCDFPPTGNMIALFEVPMDSSRRLMKLSLKISASITKNLNKLKKLGKLFKPATWIAKRQLDHYQSSEENDFHLDKEDQKNLAQDILDIMKDMERRSLRISELMQNLGSLRIVSIPEKPSYEEAKRARDLSLPFIHVDALHINRLIPENQKGRSDYLDQIMENQAHFRELLHADFKDLKIWDSPLLQIPPVGIEGLELLAQNIYPNSTVDEILNPLERTIINSEISEIYAPDPSSNSE